MSGTHQRPAVANGLSPMSETVRFAFPAIIGDIGGTNARFAVVPDAQSAVIRFPDAHTAADATIDDAIERALAGTGIRPRSALIAIAGPITGDKVPLTNVDWVVEPKRLISRFDLASVVMLNDFEALSLSLPDLGPGDVDPIGGGTAQPTGARVVVGPGTGLGAGALIHAGGTWVPVPGEGGHIDFGPMSERDAAIWPHLDNPLSRVSGETILCGPGLVRLYAAIAATDGVPARFATPAEITGAALAGSDPVAVEAVSLFAAYLGRLAGDLALVFVPRGGVYLGGGLSARIAKVLHSGGFRAAFIDKPPHNRLMDSLATAIITKGDAALAGIAAFVRAPSRFGVELSGRHWQG